jgi:hypothetical protein
VIDDHPPDPLIYTEGDPVGTCPFCAYHECGVLTETVYFDECLCLDCGRHYSRVRVAHWDHGMQRVAPVGALYAWNDLAVVLTAWLPREVAARLGSSGR